MNDLKNTYQLIDSGNGLKLESLGGYLIKRPSAQAIWSPFTDHWQKTKNLFKRTSSQTGEWKFEQRPPKDLTLKFLDVQTKIKFTDFGHLGFFAEQQHNWQKMYNSLESAKEPKVLNLFAYTGIASIACAQAGAQVTHVDASKTSVAWAAENAKLSGNNLKIRWIIDDVKKFVAREVKRGSLYDAILLDPPTYGRGTKNEVWKIETDLLDLLYDLKKILKPEFKFLCLSSHSPGHSPLVLKNSAISVFQNKALQQNNIEYDMDSYEMTIPHSEHVQTNLPSGSCCWIKPC